MKKLNKLLFAPYIYIYIYILFAIFSFWMAAQIPYTHDDWDWGLSYGIDQLLHATINSRYAGNFIVVIMTRSPLIKTFIMGLGFFLIPYLLSRVALYGRNGSDSRHYCLAFILSAIFLFMMPSEMWPQTYGWVSGFANYGVSAVFFMFWLHHINLTFNEKPELVSEHSIAYALICFLISLCSQLFLENLAIYNLILGIVLFVVYKKRLFRIPTSLLALIFGALLGFIIMFSSRLYGELINDLSYTDGLRRLVFSAGSAPAELLYYFSFQLLLLTQGLCENNTFINIFIMFTLSLLLYKSRQNISHKILYFCTFANLLYIIYFLCVINGNPLDDNFALYRYFIIIAINISYYVILCFEVFQIYRGKPLLLGKLTLLICSGPVLIAPLAITLDSGARLYFTSNLFLYVFTLIVLFDLIEYVSVNVKRIFSCAAAALLLFNLFNFGIKYNDIGRCKRIRDEYIASSIEANAESISLPDYPHDELLWVSRPYDYKRLVFFKEFYNIPESIEVNFTECTQ